MPLGNPCRNQFHLKTVTHRWTCIRSNNICELWHFIVINWSLQWRHNKRGGVFNHWSHDCLLNSLFNRRSKKTSKLRVIGFREADPPVTGEFPAQRVSNEEKVSIWWRHHVKTFTCESEPVQDGLLVVATCSNMFSWTDLLCFLFCAESCSSN